MTKAGIVIWTCMSMLVALVAFIYFYFTIEDPTVASTGYNASGKGLFGWDCSYAEHEFVPQGDVYQAVLVDSGNYISYPDLILEILVCLAVGIVVSGLFVALIGVIYDQSEKIPK